MFTHATDTIDKYKQIGPIKISRLPQINDLLVKFVALDMYRETGKLN